MMARVVASKVAAAAAAVATARAKSQSSSPKPASLTTAHLRLLLSQIGSATSGLKAVLYDRFQRALQEPVLPLARVTRNVKNGMSNRTRVLSIDMGIRNLAYCVVDIGLAESRGRHTSDSGSNDEEWRLDIVDWKRIDVVPTNKPKKTKKSKKKAAAATSENQHDSNIDMSIDNDAETFSPARLAPAAVSLAKDVFLPTNPDLIAIERQRFRSGGQSAVLEWTLRVNMLESMLWTAFKSMSDSHDVVAVSPARVAKFWVPKAAGEKSAIEKAEKVEVIRRWLRGNSPSGMTIEAKKSAAATKDMVLTGRVRGADKVDDLADCLLQAGALIMWERNRRMLSDLKMNPEQLKDYCSTISKASGDDDIT